MSRPDFPDSYIDSSESEDDGPWLSDQEYINDDSDGEGIKVDGNDRDNNYSKAFAGSVSESGDNVMDDDLVNEKSSDSSELFRKKGVILYISSHANL